MSEIKNIVTLEMMKNLIEENENLKKSLTEIRSCFEAAYAEGLDNHLVNGNIDLIRDIYSRRIEYIQGIVSQALETNYD